MLKTNYKYSATPKRGDDVLIIDAFEANKFNGRTGTVIQGFKGQSKFHKFIDVYGIGVHRFYFKSLFKISL